jgi:SAM-dependent methyltransferase
MFRMETDHFWFVGTRAVICDVLTRALEERVQRARVLDLGCGTGFTLTRLPPSVRAVGVDRAQAALALSARRNSGAALVCADAARLPFASGSFDAVLALDVLEHLSDDASAAAELHRVLVPGGVAVITVPAYAFLWSAHDVALEHKRRYRLGELRGLLERAGFAIDKASYYNTLLFPIIAGLRLAQRVRGAAGAQGTDFEMPPRPINALLSRTLGFERFLLRRGVLPVGVSCIVVARRPLTP